MSSFIEEITTIHKRRIYDVDVEETNHLQVPLNGWNVYENTHRKIQLIDEINGLAATVELENKFELSFKERVLFSKERWSFSIIDLDFGQTVTSITSSNKSTCISELEKFIKHNPSY